MKSIWYDNIEDVLLNIADPNTWGAISEVPGVSAPKINAWVSVYNVEAEWWDWIAWWSTNVTWSSSAYNSISWSSWYIYLPDWTSLSVTSWSTTLSAVTYIYYDQDSSTVIATTIPQDAVWDGKILLCVAWPTSSWKKASYQAFWTNAQSTLITADNIAANTITGNEIQANTIDTWNLKAWAVTASKMSVDELSAISADLWSITAWTITGTTITAGSTSSTAVRLNPNNNRLEFYYNWSMVWYIVGWSADWYSAIILDANYVWMLGRDTMNLYNAKLRIPVWNNLYD